MKLWEIVCHESLEPEIQKKIKRLLRPSRSVGRPQKCLFCGVDTTWTLNNQPVCPICAVRYKFLSKQWLLDPCEVCGKQGEWATEGDPQHFLCYIHRDAWFDYTKEVPLPRGWEKFPEDEKDAAWEKRFNDFIQEMKTVSV